MANITKATSKKYNIRYTVIDGTDMVNEMLKTLQISPLATVALSRAMFAGTLIAVDEKSKWNAHSFVLNGNGILGKIYVDYFDKQTRVTCANPYYDHKLVDNAKGNLVSQLVGTTGILKGIRFNEHNKPFETNVPIISGDVDLDFAYYLNQSDQIKSVIASSIKIAPTPFKVEGAKGFLAQLLPGFTDVDIEFLESKITNLQSVEHKLLEFKTNEEIIKFLDDSAKIIGTDNVVYKCFCVKDNAKKALSALTEEQILETIKSDGNIEVSCEFCSKKYHFYKEDLENFDAKKELKN